MNKCIVTQLTPHLRPCHFYIRRASLRLRPLPSILFSYFFDPAVNTKSWHLTALLLLEFLLLLLRIPPCSSEFLPSPPNSSSLLLQILRQFQELASNCPYPPSNCSSSSSEIHDNFKSWHLTATSVHFRPGYFTSYKSFITFVL